MCIISYKPKMVDMPSEQTLRNCFENNPDGAGYMFPTEQGVHIKKGFMSFKDFYDSLMNDYQATGKQCPYVLHFRIGTQGGNIAANTHPFPISQNIDDLIQLDCFADVALAHNGIIRLTTNYSTTTKTSDTMDFITEYLSLIINDSKWYKEKHQDKKKLLIERLIGGSNKLAIMSKDGNVELIGNFEYDEADKCYYSNTSYQRSSYPLYSSDDYGEYISYDGLDQKELDYFEKYLDTDGWYDFNETDCPMSICNTYDYCPMCKNYAKCWLGAPDSFSSRNCVYGKCEKCPYRADCPNDTTPYLKSESKK